MFLTSRQSSRLLVPVPTVSVSNGLLQSVSWVYNNASTGAALGAPPAYVTGVQVQKEGTGGGRIYDSLQLTPIIASDALAARVNSSSINMIHMTYNDLLGNH